MADWQIGDLALCIRARRHPQCVGRIFTVSAVAVGIDSDGKEGIGLRFTDGPIAPTSGYWLCRTFRKITPGSKIEGVEVERRVPVKERA